MRRDQCQAFIARLIASDRCEFPYLAVLEALLRRLTNDNGSLPLCSRLLPPTVSECRWNYLVLFTVSPLLRQSKSSDMHSGSQCDYVG